MDKYEYKLRSEEILKLIEKEDYTEAVNIADTIDWRRVKSITMLLKVAALYRVNRRNEDSRAILQLAYDRYPTNRSVVYSLCEVSIELDDVVAAIEYYKEFVKLAPRDNGVYTLRYRILEAQEASLEERIELLEELKKRDYQEEWAYELAYLYHRVGLATKCIEECDDLILWFGDGPYVMKAMELKQLHAPLTVTQQKKYEEMTRQSEEGYVDDGADMYAEENSDELYGDNYSDSQYTDGNYQENYDEVQYADENYSYEDNYDGTQYADENYNYENNYGDEQQYTEDNYDGNYGEEQYADENYEDNYNETQYETADYKESSSDTGSIDMSQYNTINLQKVVAESMRELFPDDENVFAANMEESEHEAEAEDTVNESEQEEDIQSTVNSEDETKHDKMSNTGRIATLVTGVSEMAPEPNTGAIKKVIVPGNNARMIQAESDIDEIRETTEADIIKEQSRFERNEENVYIDQPSMLENEEMPEQDEHQIEEKAEDSDVSDALADNADVNDSLTQDAETESVNEQLADSDSEQFTPMTGQMNIEDVLNEWENMKKQNAKKRQEEVRKLVLQQTGKIFEDFDNSVKTGILGELEASEAQDSALADSETHNEETQEDVPELVELESVSTVDDISDIEGLSELESLSGIDEVSSSETDEMKEASEAEEVLETEEVEGLSEAEEFEEVEELSEIEELPETDEFTEVEEFSETEELAEIEETSDMEEFAETEEFAQAEEYSEDELTQETEEFYPEYEEDVEEDSYRTMELPDRDGLAAAQNIEDVAAEEPEDLIKTQEISFNTAEISSLPDKIIETTKKETKGVKREELREFTPDEQELFENFAVTKKIKKQIINALDKMSLTAYTGNVIITGEPGLGTLRLSKNLIRKYQEKDENFSGKVAKITGDKLNIRDLSQTFNKIANGAIIIEKANGLTDKTLYEMSTLLNQDDINVIVIMEDTKKEITKLLAKQAMISDYFNVRIDLTEMDNNALVAYAKNYAQALEYSIDELGTLALYTRIANIQSGNHVVTKNEVRDIVDEAIWKSKKFRLKTFVDVLFAKRYDQDDMIVLKERDFI